MTITLKDILWAMNVREAHKRDHTNPMNQCETDCVKADTIISEDRKQKFK